MSKIFHLPQNRRIIEHINEEYTYNHKFKYGSKANVDLDYDQGHWKIPILNSEEHLYYDHGKMPFIQDHPAVKILWDQFQELVGPRVLLRAYINGYTYGTDGYAHKDDPWINELYGDDALSETVIYYLNEKWDHNWGGETVVFDNEFEIMNAVLPRPCRMFVFDSNNYHASRPLSRSCSSLRSVLVFKTASEIVNNKKVEFILKNYSNDSFRRLLEIARVMNKNKMFSELVQGSLFVDTYKDGVAPSREYLKELLGDYTESVLHEYSSMKDPVETLCNDTNINSVMKRDLCVLHCAVTHVDEGPEQDIDRLTKVIESIENKVL